MTEHDTLFSRNYGKNLKLPILFNTVLFGLLISFNFFCIIFSGGWGKWGVNSEIYDYEEVRGDKGIIIYLITGTIC